ncbi:MAG: carboxymuconolactone decarboxylase family protein [Chitinophagaceae bacterium]|nr:carboxymuconolactone decarboxylase family protein [Chitinophagaceae bacterium]
MDTIKEFRDYREKMNNRILSSDNLVIKRIYNLDTNAYSKGALDIKTKEMLGLACSLVLRCDDCVKYHLDTCYKVGITDAEIEEVWGIATLIGGTIVIPHLRRAVEFWDLLKEKKNAEKGL